jgi:hypothetical protein
MQTRTVVKRWSLAISLVILLSMAGESLLG